MTPVDVQQWQSRFATMVQNHDVPGAVLAVLHDGQVTELAAGLLNVETGVRTTADSLFQIGSITKSYTSTMIMQLVDEARLGLDQQLTSVLPELDLADPEAAGQVTVRQLLSHTSGIEGDHFADTGRGDDVLARYVDSCAGLGFSHPVGATMSYCNTGLVLAGRMIEILTGQSWDDALRERILEPLGVTRTVTLPEDAVRFRVAHGHRDDHGTARLTSQWSIPRALGPAGLVCATAGDLVAFARMHLAGGASAGGKPVLSPSGVAQMQSPQVRLPDRWTLGSHWGLGWCLFDWDGRRVYGHDGNTIGQSAYLRVVPDADVAIALLTNGGHATDLYHELFRELLAELCGLRMPRSLIPPERPPRVDVTPYAGVYERVGIRIELDNDNGTLSGRVISTGDYANLDEEPIDEIELTPITDSVFVTHDQGEQTWTPMVFYALADGAPYLHMGGRATPRRDTT